MRSLRSEVSVIFVVALAFTALSSVRSEYTWNGSEWVWSETSEPKEQDAPDANSGYEGSGGGAGGDGYGDDMDDNFDDEYNVEEGSGAYAEENEFDSNSNPGSNFNSNSNKNNNNNNQNSYSRNNQNNGFNEDYNNNGYNVNPNTNNGGSLNGGQDYNSQYNNNYNNYAPSTKAPSYYNPEKTEGDDIYVDPPVVPATTTTTTVAPGDPSIRPKNASRPTSFFAQPGTLAAVIGGAVVGLLCAILCVMFVVYRMRKKDEGSYALDEPKRSPTVNAYAKHPSREFYA